MRPRFRRDVQLGAVLISHGVILVGVVITTWAFVDFPRHGTPTLWLGVPPLFLVGEVVIIVLCFVLLPRSPWFRDMFGWVPREWESLIIWVQKRRPSREQPRQRKPWDQERIDNVKGNALLIAFGLQLAALAFLLNETGGPVNSPFAQMVLAYTIFTPILAREPRTMGLVLLISIIYYGLLVGFMDPADGVSSEKWAYFCVNGLFATVPVVIGIVEGRDRARRHREDEQLEAASVDEGSRQLDDDSDAGKSLTPTG